MKMKKALQLTLMVLTLSSLGLLATPPAHSGCGDEVEGTWDDTNRSCSGAHANCTTITVCPPAE